MKFDDQLYLSLIDIQQIMRLAGMYFYFRRNELLVYLIYEQFVLRPLFRVF